MKLLLATFLVLNLAVAGWAGPIEVSVGENTVRSFKQFLTDLVAEETGPSVRTNCDLTLTATTGTISSPNYPQNYPASLNCYWIIASSTRTVITLSFDAFVIEDNFDFLRVYDGPTPTSPLLKSMTGYSTPPPFSSTGNVMSLYLTTNSNNQFAGFSSRYSVTPTIKNATELN